MEIPDELQEVITRFFLELNKTEQLTIDGLNLIRPLLAKRCCTRDSDLAKRENLLLIDLFASLNNSLLFVEISRRRIQITVNRISQIKTSMV